MGGYIISEQLAMFLRSIALGGALGLVYDLLRTLRRLGGRLWGGVLDALYCVLAVSSLFLFMMAGSGELHLFVLMGTLGGAVLFFCLLSHPLRPLWDFWLTVLLAPVCRLWLLLKKSIKIGKKVFFSLRKRLTMIHRFPRRPGAVRKEGGSEMSKAVPVPGKTKKKKEQKGSGSRLAVIILAALLLGAGIQLSSLFSQLQDAREEEAAYAERLADLQETNNRLRQDIENSGDLSLTKDIARDELGMVSPGEKIIRFK